MTPKEVLFALGSQSWSEELGATAGEAGLLLEEEIDNLLRGLDERGFAIVPKKPTEEMIDAACELDAYDIAVQVNRRSHEELMAKYPGLKPRDTHGAAGVQTIPLIWEAMLGAVKKNP